MKEWNMRIKKVYAVILCILMTLTLSCCGVKGQLSDKYLVGYNFGDSGHAGNDGPDRNVMEVRICYDGTVDVLLMSLNDDSDYEIAGSYQLTADELSRLTAAIDQSKLYRLDPQENGAVCDGGCKILYLYDKKGLVLKRCGGYMPQNEEFLKMYETVQEVFHDEEQTQIYKEWLETNKQK